MSTSELFLCKKYSLYVTQSEIELAGSLALLCDYDKSVCYCNIATAEYGEYSRVESRRVESDMFYLYNVRWNAVTKLLHQHMLR